MKDLWMPALFIAVPVGGFAGVRLAHSDDVVKVNRMHEYYVEACTRFNALDAKEEACRNSVPEDSADLARCLDPGTQAAVDRMMAMSVKRNMLEDELGFPVGQIIAGGNWGCPSKTP